MARKITRKKFIEAIENNEEGLTSKEMSDKLGISRAYYYKLRKKYRDEIVDAARELVKSVAADQVNNLVRNARSGDTQAAKTLLEMTKLGEKERPSRIELVLVSGVEEKKNDENNT